jgi:ribose transport system substrate-binding protein
MTENHQEEIMLNRRSLIGAAGVAALLSLAGPAMAQDIYIPLVSKGFQHQFWQAVKTGAEQAAKDMNVRITFEGPDSETMVDKQIDMLSAALAKNPKALGFAALDSQAAIPLLRKAQSAKILVVHDQTSRTGIDRRDGFVNRVKEKYPKINIVSIQYGGGDHLKSTEITKSILQANPKLKGIFGANEGSAIGVVNGAKEMNRKLVIIGYDSGKQQKQAIQDGLMAGAITQNPVGIGYKTVEAAVKALKGEKLEKVIDTGFYYYDKSNMSDPKIASVLYD